MTNTECWRVIKALKWAESTPQECKETLKSLKLSESDTGDLLYFVHSLAEDLVNSSAVLSTLDEDDVQHSAEHVVGLGALEYKKFKDNIDLLVDMATLQKYKENFSHLFY